MRSNIFKEIKISIYIFSALLFAFVLFYLVATMFISMGYKGFKKSKAVDATLAVGSTIIIDPGHGGIDPGACANGLVEKDLNLEISLLLSEYLESFGYNCDLTRREDIMLYDPEVKGSKKRQDLNNRVLFAEKYPDPCFISIHMNKFPQENCKGLQVFYSANDEGSKVLAESLRSSVTALQPDNNRTIKNGTKDIYLLESLNIPAVLVECGFLSNFEEAKLLNNVEYKMALSLSMYCGIADYLEHK